MAGESRFRSWLTRLTGGENHPRDTTEQNAISSTV